MKIQTTPSESGFAAHPTVNEIVHMYMELLFPIVRIPSEEIIRDPMKHSRCASTTSKSLPTAPPLLQHASGGNKR